MSSKSIRNILLTLIALVSYDLFGLQSVNDYALIVPYLLLCLLFLIFFLLSEAITVALEEIFEIDPSEAIFTALKDQKYSQMNVFFCGSLFFDFALMMPSAGIWITFFDFVERFSGIKTDLIQLFRYVAVFFLFHSVVLTGVELFQLLRLKQKIEEDVDDADEDDKADTKEHHD